MARLPYVVADSAPEHVQRALERLPDLNVFRLMANADTIFIPWLRYGGALLGETALDPALRELAILRVSRLTPGAEYEWVQHVGIGKAVGVTDDQIAALERDDVEAAAFDPLQQAVLVLVEQVIRDGAPTDAVYDVVADALPPREIVELLAVIGAYRMLGTVMATARIDIDGPLGDEVVRGAQEAARRRSG